MSIVIPSVCVGLGACIIEKHFTIDRTLKGPDHKFALEPRELKAMVKNIRNTEAALGSPKKYMVDAEQNLYRLARRSIIAKRKIPKGKTIERNDLIIKRPGYGIPPKFLDIIIGRIFKKYSSITIFYCVLIDFVIIRKIIYTHTDTIVS